METNNMQELEQMRSQLNTLKQKLDNQEIVNDRLLRQTFRQKMSYGQNYSKVALFVLLPSVAIIFISTHFTVGFSWAFIAFTILMVFGSAFNDYRITHFGTDNLFDGDMLSAAQQLVEKNRQMRLSYKIGMSVVAVWAIWLFFELLTTVTMPGFYASGESLQALRYAMAIGMAVGGIIGGVVGYGIYKKILRNNQEVIDQINDLTE